MSEIRSLSQGGSELLAYHEVIKQTLGINRKPFYTHAQHSHPIEKQSRPVSELYKPRARVIGDETGYRETVFPRPSDVSDAGRLLSPCREARGPSTRPPTIRESAKEAPALPANLIGDIE